MTIANRPILITFYSSYFVSFLLLLLASTDRSPLPAWGGYLDAGLVVVILVLSFMIFGRGKSNPGYEAGHRAALYVLPMLLLGMWVFRDTLDFNILLPGLAWRTFFFLHILPYGVNLWKIGTPSE
jgi:hypothetical protein